MRLLLLLLSFRTTPVTNLRQPRQRTCQPFSHWGLPAEKSGRAAVKVSSSQQQQALLQARVHFQAAVKAV
jgi:hypothetical protein